MLKTGVLGLDGVRVGGWGVVTVFNPLVHTTMPYLGHEAVTVSPE